MLFTFTMGHSKCPTSVRSNKGQKGPLEAAHKAFKEALRQHKNLPALVDYPYELEKDVMRMMEKNNGGAGIRRCVLNKP